MQAGIHGQGGDHSFKFRFFPKKERKHEDLILKMVSLGFKWEYTKYGNKHISIIHLPILKIKTYGFKSLHEEQSSRGFEYRNQSSNA